MPEQDPVPFEYKITEQDWEKLRQRFAECTERLANIEQAHSEISGSGSFKDITSNFITPVQGRFQLLEKGKGKNESTWNDLTSRLSTLEQYLTIIEQYPEIAEKEYKEMFGAFPEIHQAAMELQKQDPTISRYTYYIDHLNSKLN